VLLANEDRTGDLLPLTVDLSFASEQWQRTVLVATDKGPQLARRHFEVCVFVALASALKAGDVAVDESDAYADYREQLLTWPECEPQVAEYCGQTGLPHTASELVAGLRAWLAETAQRVDTSYPSNGQVVITDKGEPVLKRGPRRQPSGSALALEAALFERIPERNMLDALANVSHWTQWWRHLGPVIRVRAQAGRPDAALCVDRFCLRLQSGPGPSSPTYAGAGQRPRALVHQPSPCQRRPNRGRHQGPRQRLPPLRFAEGVGQRLERGRGRHQVRSGREQPAGRVLDSLWVYGGIAYHHVSDTYVALFSHFIPCGVWEAIYILEGLLKNTSDIQPTTIHADTQGQSAPVFGLAHLLGIKLMPRIRNWKDLRFFRPSTDARYKHIDSLFSDTIDWDLIETHWPDLL